MSGKDGSMEKHCRTSKVVVEKLAGYIETDECVKACGVDRDAVGISSDAFLEPHFLQNMCSNDCYEKCPNLVELFFKLAAGEGKIRSILLPYLCERQRTEPHLDMRESMSSLAASGPASDQEEVESAMTPAPASEQVDDAIAPSPASEQVEELDDVMSPVPASKQVEEEDGAMAPAAASKQFK